MEYIIAILLIYFIINGIASFKFAAIAKEKGADNPDQYIWWVILTGVLGALMVIALPNKSTLEKQVDDQ